MSAPRSSSPARRPCRPGPAAALLAMILLAGAPLPLSTGGSRAAAQQIPSPAEHFGHVMGADRKLVGWDGMVEYLTLVGRASDRVNVRETGKTTDGRPFLLVEVSSPETMADLDRYKALQQRLYFQDHRPGQDPGSLHSDAQRAELFSRHKAVILITCSIHASEVGAAQMSLELVHTLASSDDPRIRKILDNVILLLVPSLNPDGLDMVKDWYDEYVGTPFEGGSMPWLYQRYVGHDNNRDMYMYTQQETRLIGEILWKEWFPSIWLDQHQMGSRNARIFVMPATDPINTNVHPLIYRWNGIYGQLQGAALEEAGKVGIVYDQTYTNFWIGAMAWTGWWHNQVGMLTEMASVRIATPTLQGPGGLAGSGGAGTGGGAGGYEADAVQPPPTDVQPRTNYPRPWLGGRWTLRDIVEYELVLSLATLEGAADTRETLNRQIYEVNRSTIQQFMEGVPAGGPDEELGGYGPLPPRVATEKAGTGRVMPGALGAAGTPWAVVFPPDQGDPATRAKLLQLMERAGVRVEESTGPFTANGEAYPAGTYVIRLAQVYGRYAKEMLEAQTYPEIRLAPDLPPLPPYDVTAWSLGLQMGVGAEFVDRPFDVSLRLVEGVAVPAGGVVGEGDSFLLSSAYNDAFTAVNRLWAMGARVRRAEGAVPVAGSGEAPAPGTFVTEGGSAALPAGTFVVEGVSRSQMDGVARELGVQVHAVRTVPGGGLVKVRKPRIALFQPWQSNMDEGWTRWVLEAYGFDYDILHPQDFLGAAAASGVRPGGAPGAPGAAAAATADSVRDLEIASEYRRQWPPHVRERAPERILTEPLRDRYDVILFAHQGGTSILEGSSSSTIPEPYRGGLGEEGLAALREFVLAGGRVVALGSASGLFLDHWPIPVKDASQGLTRDEFLIPGSIVNLVAETSHPLAWGMGPATHGFFSGNPFFEVDGVSPAVAAEGFPAARVSVAVRYPAEGLRASGWLRGEEILAGKAAAVEVRFPGGPAGGGAGAASAGQDGSLVLLGLRPQHRAQTHATFKLLFNALMR